MTGVSRSWLATLLVTLASALGACDRSVTSVGDWSPPEQPQGLYVEAESGELTGGFTVGEDAAASGGQFLLAPDVSKPEGEEGGARARYQLTVPVDGDYVLWGRIYSPDISSNRFHVQMDGGTRYLWRITVGTIWYWDDVHDDVSYDEPLHFRLRAGEHELVIGSVAAGARLDRLYLTAGDDEPPGNDTPCRPPHSIDLGGVCHESCGSRATLERATTCGCDGRAEADLFPAYDCVGGSCCFAQAEMP
jgi:hypothetical protein